MVKRITPRTGPSGQRLSPPIPEARLAIVFGFYEAMARTADRLNARPEDLPKIPLLFDHSGAFDKRMHDVSARNRETLNLPSCLKRLIKERFPDFHFATADGEEVSFRKGVSPTLDLLLNFERRQMWGLGKTFTVEFAVEFPNTPFGRMHSILGGPRQNIFWMFHHGWDKRYWAYTTGTELTMALSSCGDLLERFLPTFEDECRRLLIPPGVLPPGITRHGELSARQAYELILPMARAWADDIELESAASSYWFDAHERVGTAIGWDGRLRPNGSWGFKFLSKRLDMHALYAVPHTGRVWWNFYPVVQGVFPKYDSVVSADGWIDSTVVSAHSLRRARKELGNPPSYDISMTLHAPRRYENNFVWRSNCSVFGKTKFQHRSIMSEMDAFPGPVSSGI